MTDDMLGSTAEERAAIYNFLTKEQIIQIYEDVERENIAMEAHIEGLEALTVSTAVAFEHLVADLREGPDSPNYQFSVRDLVEGGPTVVLSLLNAAGQNAVDAWYGPLTQAYEELRATVKADRESEQ